MDDIFSVIRQRGRGAGWRHGGLDRAGRRGRRRRCARAVATGIGTTHISPGWLRILDAEDDLRTALDGWIAAHPATSLCVGRAGCAGGRHRRFARSVRRGRDQLCGRSLRQLSAAHSSRRRAAGRARPGELRCRRCAQTRRHADRRAGGLARLLSNPLRRQSGAPGHCGTGRHLRSAADARRQSVRPDVAGAGALVRAGRRAGGRGHTAQAQAGRRDGASGSRPSSASSITPKRGAICKTASACPSSRYRPCRPACRESASTMH